MSKLYVMCGCPGSGKSTWAKKNLADAVYISSDDIRLELCGTYDPGVDEPRVFATFYGRITSMLASGKDVVADATNLTPWRRKKALDCCNGDEAIAVCMTTPLKEALRRNAGRDRQVPEDAVRGMYCKLRNNPPTKAEGFAKVMYVS